MVYPFFRFSFPNGSMVQTMARWCLCRLMPCTVAASMFAFDLLHHWTSWWQELGGCGMGCSQLGDSFGHQKWAFEHQQNRFSHWIVTQNRFVQVAVFMGKLMMFLVGFMCWIAKWRRTGGLKSIDGIDSSSVAYPIFPRAISVANWVLAKVVDPVVTWNASFPGRVQERV